MSVITVTDSTFEAEVLQSAIPTVVEFTTRIKTNKSGADNASAKMDKTIDSLAASYAGTVKFVRVEIELDQDLKDTLNPSTSAKYEINHGPTLVLIKGGARAKDSSGTQVDDLVGNYTDEQVRTWVSRIGGGKL
ncbi:thioredoxin family protein [Pseudomonas sp. Pseusp122]|uniref:thioredoxin family protein n=1 Tax=unclassified Pseudomonas TaxID=196821 RepID=UPI0039A4ACB3